MLHAAPLLFTFAAGFIALRLDIFNVFIGCRLFAININILFLAESKLYSDGWEHTIGSHADIS